ncbi:MAG: hypothetical protein JSR80_05115 [Verrucomicrobia bacterium]|nr:hypothetical protein [Verrucomicrobiota bacterium]
MANRDRLCVQLMSDALFIYPDRLRGGKTETLQGVLPAEAIGPEFSGGIAVGGEAYLAGERLVLSLDLDGEVKIPCKICNHPVAVPLGVRGYCHVEELEGMRPRGMCRGKIDLTPIIRGILLVEVPPFAECEGSCPERKRLEEISKKESHGFHPFEKLLP